MSSAPSIWLIELEISTGSSASIAELSTSITTMMPIARRWGLKYLRMRSISPRSSYVRSYDSASSPSMMKPTSTPSSPAPGERKVYRRSFVRGRGSRAAANDPHGSGREDRYPVRGFAEKRCPARRVDATFFGNCSELRGRQELAAGIDRVDALQPPGAKQGRQRHARGGALS